MATYTTIDTEDLGNNQTRTIRAYDAISAGVAFNVYVELTIKSLFTADVQQPIVDTEIFIPGITVSQLTGASFTTTDNEDLGAGQRRLTRELTLPGGGKVISIVITSEYREGGQTRTIVTREHIYLQKAATP